MELNRTEGLRQSRLLARDMGDFVSGLVRYVHILSGVMWVGGLFLWGMLIAPTLAKRVPPGAAPPVLRPLIPRLSRYLLIAGVLAILSGVVLIQLIWDSPDAGFRAEAGGYGIAMSSGLLGALVMLAIGLFVSIPSGKKLLALPPPAPGAGPHPEAAKLQKRLMMGTMVNLALGSFVLLTMVWATNVFR